MNGGGQSKSKSKSSASPSSSTTSSASSTTSSLSPYNHSAITTSDASILADPGSDNSKKTQVILSALKKVVATGDEFS
jgi:hypothetical protein